MNSGNNPLTERFFASLREKKIASAYIIEGPEGVGKLDTARRFSAALCCLSPRPDASPCLACKPCRQIMEGEFIDVSELRPDSPEKQITVESVRGITGDASLLPSEAEWRVFIIEHSQRMNGAAQNALLKSIEEPPSGVVFFLLTEDRSALLPTVVSRAVTLRIKPLSEEALRDQLRGEYPGESEEKLASAAALAAGSVGKAREILSGSELLSECDHVIRYLEAISASAGLASLSEIFAPAAQNRQSLAIFLPLLKLGLRDVLLCQAVRSDFAPELFRDRELLRRVALGIPPKKAALLFRRVCELILQLTFNVNAFAAVSGLNLAACSK